ncbi:MAG TPA: hypothetical protein VGV86_01130 [Acidimicrobiales bacterium]|nr:hypothetical protein [Acidimicrobiales bacterium]
MTRRHGTAEPPDNILEALPFGSVDEGADQGAGGRSDDQADWPGEETDDRSDQATPDGAFRCDLLRVFQSEDPAILRSLDDGHGLESELSGAVEALQRPDPFTSLFDTAECERDDVLHWSLLGGVDVPNPYLDSHLARLAGDGVRAGTSGVTVGHPVAAPMLL